MTSIYTGLAYFITIDIDRYKIRYFRTNAIRTNDRTPT